MKTFNLTSFFSGIIFSLVIFTFFAFSNSSIFKNSSLLNNIKITSTKANTYKQNFQQTFPGKLAALNIPVQQWSAINKAVEDLDYNLEEVSGFRIYFGLKNPDRNAKKVAMIYTINNSFKVNEPSSSAMVNMAEGYDDKYNQQCPPYCD